MTGAEAEKIINDYGAAITSIKEDEHVQDIFSLPYSPAKIRYAFFVYAETLYNDGLLTEEIVNNLSHTYAMLNTRFVEEADEINAAWNKFEKEKDMKAYDALKEKGGISAFMPSVEMMVEFNNYIADLHGNWNK